MGHEIDGQTVLVIGGSKFLGETIARRAAAHGARVVIGARDLERATAVAETLPAGRAIRIDITDETAIADAAARLGSVDHIVVTAAAHHNVPVTEVQKSAVVAAFDAKVFGPLLVAKHFAPILPATGSILLFSGVAAWTPSAPYTVMGVANGAVAFLASHLAKELAPVRVNAISPGIVDSGTWDALGSAAKQSLLDSVAGTTLAGRAGRADDIADAALWLLGAGYVTGETIHVEGGARFA